MPLTQYIWANNNNSSFIFDSIKVVFAITICKHMIKFHIIESGYFREMRSHVWPGSKILVGQVRG